MLNSRKVADTYDQIGLYFSATRPHLSKDVISLLPLLSPTARVLDLGCGNGVLLTCLPAGRPPQNYTGIDISQVLINEARRLHPGNDFQLANILDQTVWDNLPQYNFIAALAVLHHLPTSSHLALLSQIKDHLKPTGSVLVSVWRLDQQQPKFDRFRTSAKHLSIPFHGGPKRSFYAFSPDELASLAKQTKLAIITEIQTRDNLFLLLKKS